MRAPESTAVEPRLMGAGGNGSEAGDGGWRGAMEGSREQEKRRPAARMIQRFRLSMDVEVSR